MPEDNDNIPAPQGKLSVLVCEDITIMRDLLSKNLAKSGIRIVPAGDGLEAVSKAKKFKPDIILMDIMMPRLNGIEACKRIKQDEETKHIPIVMCTAKSSRKDILDAMRAGAADYIVKPFKIGTVVMKLRKAYGTSQQELDDILGAADAESGEVKDEIDPEFDSACRRLLLAGAAELVIDFSKTTYLSSTYVGMVAAIFFEARRVNKTLRVKTRKRVADLFKLCGFDDESMLTLEIVE